MDVLNLALQKLQFHECPERCVAETYSFMDVLNFT